MKRPKQHIIETQSRKAFESLVPHHWVHRSLSPDYGLDYLIEIFKNSEATGQFFYVQLKGIEQKLSGNKIKISLSVSTFVRCSG